MLAPSYRTDRSYSQPPPSYRTDRTYSKQHPGYADRVYTTESSKYAGRAYRQEPRGYPDGGYPAAGLYADERRYADAQGQGQTRHAHSKVALW